MLQSEHISVAGVVIALLFAAYGVLKFRGGGSRLDLLLSLVIAPGAALVPVVPQIFEPVSRLLGLENRAFALLGLANLLLFALFLNLLGRVRAAGRRSGEIVTGLAVRDYEENYLSPKERMEGHPGGILIIVPAYDEEGGIRDALRRLPAPVLGQQAMTVVGEPGPRCWVTRKRRSPCATARRPRRRPSPGQRACRSLPASATAVRATPCAPA